MSADEKKEQLLKLYLEGVDGTEGLYSRIPSRFRFGIDYNSFVDSQNWETSDYSNCKSLYESCMGKARAYVNSAKGDTQNLSRGCDVKESIYLIEERYSGKPVAFVREMREVLRREKELLFLHNSLNRSDDSKTVTEKEENAELKQIEDYTEPLNEIQGYFRNLRTNVNTNDRRREDFNSTRQPFASNDNGNIASLDNIITADLTRTVNDLTNISYNYYMSQEECLSYFWNLRDSMTKLYRILERDIVGLQSHREEWLQSQARQLGQTGSILCLDTLKTRFSNYGKTLFDLALIFVPEYNHLKERDHWPQADFNSGINLSFTDDLDALVHRFMDMALIVSKQTEGVVSIEKNKASKTYETRTRSSLEVTIHLLGLDHTNIETETPTVKVVSDARNSSSPTEEKTTVTWGEIIKVGKDCTIKGIHISGFTREHSNNVYSQFHRLVFTQNVKVSSGNWSKDFTVQMKSLPIMFYTGSSQLNEMCGALSWYIDSTPDIYADRCELVESRPIDDVIEMIHKMFVCNCAGRGLSDEDRITLKKRVRKTNRDDTMSIQEFLKNKLRADNPTEDNKTELDFSFHTWVKAVMNLMGDARFVQAWIKGIIYGFILRDDAKKMLLAKDVPVGTFIIRPNLTLSLHTRNSEKIKGHLNFDIKKSETEVETVWLLYEYLEEHRLYKIAKGMSIDKKKICKILRGRGNVRLTVDDLKEFSSENAKSSSHYVGSRIHYVLTIELGQKPSYEADLDDEERQKDQFSIEPKRKVPKPSQRKTPSKPIDGGETSGRCQRKNQTTPATDSEMETEEPPGEFDFNSKTRSEVKGLSVPGHIVGPVCVNAATGQQHPNISAAASFHTSWLTEHVDVSGIDKQEHLLSQITEPQNQVNLLTSDLALLDTCCQMTDDDKIGANSGSCQSSASNSPTLNSLSDDLTQYSSPGSAVSLEDLMKTVPGEPFFEMVVTEPNDSGLDSSPGSQY